MDILLVAISEYFINGYQWILYYQLLQVILSQVIGNSYIVGYLKLCFIGYY